MEFPEGLYVDKPHENAPDFVKAKLSIKREVFIKWLLAQEGEYVNLNVKESKAGDKWYASVDDWEPSGERQAQPAPRPQGNDDFDDDIPF